MVSSSPMLLLLSSLLLASFLLSVIHAEKITMDAALVLAESLCDEQKADKNCAKNQRCRVLASGDRYQFAMYWIKTKEQAAELAAKFTKDKFAEATLKGAAHKQNKTNKSKKSNVDLYGSHLSVICKPSPVSAHTSPQSSPAVGKSGSKSASESGSESEGKEKEPEESTGSAKPHKIIISLFPSIELGAAAAREGPSIRKQMKQQKH